MKRVLVGLAVVALVAFLSFVGVVTWKIVQDPITPENCQRIEPGMSRTDLEAILGSPHEERSGIFLPLVGPVGKKSDLKVMLSWHGQACDITILLSQTDQVGSALGVR